MTQTIAPAFTRSDRLLKTLADYRDFLVVMHDNPDPDAIASGWAICCLIEERLGRPVRLVAGGAIVRAENRQLVELLNPPVELVARMEVSPHTAAILVDCALSTTNQLLTREAVHPVAIIDHHEMLGDRRDGVAFHDIRPGVTASASIAASYLREQRIEPGPKLATAMLYAIRSEARGSESRFARLDRAMITWLTERAEPSLMASIENAPLSRSYFGDLQLAIQGTRLYDNAALCLLPRASGPEIVGEVADLLIRCDEVRRVLCGAFVAADLVVSVRTEPGSGNAARLLETTLEGLGSGGGHTLRAGGKISGIVGEKAARELRDKLRRRWLSACGIRRRRGVRLVSRREILEHL